MSNENQPRVPAGSPQGGEFSGFNSPLAKDRFIGPDIRIAEDYTKHNLHQMATQVITDKKAAYHTDFKVRDELQRIQDVIKTDAISKGRHY
jgi:hypothetical protein